MKISEKYKEKWITALTSGKYTQAEGELYDGHGNYCAVGVALHACSNIPKRRLEQVTIANDLCTEDIKKIPSELMDGSIINSEIMEFNDDDLHSFEWIADWINKNVETA